MNLHIAEWSAKPAHCILGVTDLSTLWRAEREHHGCRLVVVAHQLKCPRHGHHVQHRWSRGDQDEVGMLRSLERDIFGKRWCVNNSQFASLTRPRF